MTEPRTDRVIHYASRSRAESNTAFPSTEAQLIRQRQDSLLKQQMPVAEYEEVDHSGKYLRGPKLREALELLKSGQANVLKVTRWNRIARNLYRRWEFYQMLLSWGCRVETLDDKLDFDSAKGRLIGNVLGAIDQFASEEAGELFALKIRQRVLDKGMYSGPPPFGYRMRMQPDPADPRATISSGFMEIHPERAAELIRLKDWLLENRSITFTLDLAAQAGLTRPRQSAARQPGASPVHWTRCSLEYVLLNPVYLGLIPYKGALYPGQHPPLFAQEEHDAMRAIITACKGSAGKGDRRDAHVYLLSSRLWFAEVTDEGPRYDSYFGYASSKKRADGQPYRYYRRLSSTRRHYAGETRPAGVKLLDSQLRIADIEHYVLEQIRVFVSNASAWQAMAARTAHDCTAGLGRVKERLAMVESIFDLAAAERQQIRTAMLAQPDTRLQAELAAMLADIDTRQADAEQLKLDCLALHDWYSTAEMKLAGARDKYGALLAAYDKGQRRVCAGLLKDLLAAPYGVVVWPDHVEINIRAGAVIELQASQCVEIENKRGIPAISAHLLSLFAPLHGQRAA